MTAMGGISGTAMVLVLSFIFWILSGLTSHSPWAEGIGGFLCFVAYLLVVPFLGGVVWLLKNDGLEWKGTAFACLGHVVFWLISSLFGGILFILFRCESSRAIIHTVGFFMSVFTLISAVAMTLFWAALLKGTREGNSILNKLRYFIIPCICFAAVVAVSDMFCALQWFNALCEYQFDINIHGGMLREIYCRIPTTVLAVHSLFFSAAQILFMMQYQSLLNKEGVSPAA